MRFSDEYDVAVIGAGPVGAACALAFARRGARVLLLEQDPPAVGEGAVGEWLHPAAMDAIEGLGVDLRPPRAYPSGKGFVVCPDDGGEPLVLPYQVGRFGFALERPLLVETLRAYAEGQDGIDYVPFARATRVEGKEAVGSGKEHPRVLTYEHRGRPRTARAGLVVGATGANVRAATRGESTTFEVVEGPPTHRLAALSLEATLPFEGYLHLAVGGPGPALAYRVAPSRVRLLLDVPLSASVPREGGVALFEAFAPGLPEPLVEPLRRALAEGPPTWAPGRLRPRTFATKGGVVWIGDAAGTLHPLTAADLGLGLGDAVGLAEANSPAAFARARRRESRMAETVAVGLNELFADAAPESLALRGAVYALWRQHSSERLHAMGFIAGERAGILSFAGSCLRVLGRGTADVWLGGARSGQLEHAAGVYGDLLRRLGWMMGGSLGLTEALPRELAERLEARGAGRFGRALSRAEPRGEVVGLPSGRRAPAPIEQALERGVDALLVEQAEDGSFEGEVVWCPMLAAQYVLAHHFMDRPLPAERRRLLLRHFEHTKLPGGAWGLHEKSEPYLFVTTLVYVAARLLGLAKDDPLLVEAHAFIRAEGGAVNIPSWGKLWLALVGLYDYRGVTPVVPELWRTPRWLPMHPSRYYCHTRLIYLGMATLYGERASRAPTPTIRAVSDEIFTTPYDEIDFARARETVRGAELHVPPSPALTLSYRALGLFDRLRGKRPPEGLLAELRERIRYELRSTSHTCISPVSGLLDILALHSADRNDPDVEKALERFEGWIWEDEEEGTRVAGARSASWDTAFAAQSLAAVAPFVDVSEGLRKADDFLRSQQIRHGTGEESANDRIDPRGGYCFAGVWHGWPVSDCTAEAVLARLGSPVGNPTAEEMAEAIAFILRTQNEDGGFGSYEARRGWLPLDWLNPSEMFGACMTERSYVECTASCIAALAAYRARYPSDAGPEVDRAIEAAVRSLRSAQRPDGSFSGMWGVHFIYGTLFGIRGLLAAGVPPVDPQIRRAAAWLEERQRPDGAWGEHFRGVIEDRYVEHEQGQVVQTAWALSALCEAEHPRFAVLERAAHWLAARQGPDGLWPKQDPEGIFFHTALLEYRLYRRYFPLWALGLYQRRATARRLEPTRRSERAPGPRA